MTPQATPAVTARWEFAALSDAGRVRRNNEDAIAFDPALGLAVLADGMGGYNGGEVASGMAIALLQAGFGRWLAHAGASAPPRAMRRAMQKSVDETNRAIFEAGAANPQLRGMGTTLVLAAFGADRAVVGHIGDSRCYRWRGHDLELLTRDHSLLQERLDAGALTQEQAALFPYRNLVTRALGIERQVEVEVGEHGAQAGDLFLLCSDGLSEMLAEPDMGTILSRNVSLAQKATLLVAAANDNGGKDNISVLLAQAAVAGGRSSQQGH
ncbi:Stp1/IreP family PP2C-type Ser/Thr phosphatase [Xenophilus sp. Marseille-Q4582]|uniref:Stp1/IreP family PP2C-type Ser/Thr phosphatase n=1 Tax=Xenophilus sp. Marseille-Q4582 TaxID=2866600 RepID=UPI001CE475F2|nr:Stp1/IreP family PP2C-type Ser/Thr phosphatase [Xenophilus sp. Marseille-Q4582]